MPEPLFFVNLGLGGAFLVILFIGLAKGTIYTKKSVDVLLEEKEKRLADKDKYIDRLERINDTIDARNDLLASRIDHLLEVSRAQGMIDALPHRLGERVVQ